MSRRPRNHRCGRSPKHAPPELPGLRIRVLDGDSGKPVQGARVEARGAVARSTPRGLASFQLSERSSLKVAVSAPGYEPVETRARIRRQTGIVRVWKQATQWPIYGATPARTQVHPAIGLRPPFRRIWRRSLHGLVEFPAVVWGGVAYVNNMHGWLRALSMRTGRVLWKRHVGSLMASSPAIDPERKLLVVTTMEPGYVKVARSRHRPGPLAVLHGADRAFAGDPERRRLLRRDERRRLRASTSIGGSPAGSSTAA